MYYTFCALQHIMKVIHTDEIMIRYQYGYDSYRKIIYCLLFWFLNKNYYNKDFSRNIEDRYPNENLKHRNRNRNRKFCFPRTWTSTRTDILLRFQCLDSKVLIKFNNLLTKSQNLSLICFNFDKLITRVNDNVGNKNYMKCFYNFMSTVV